VKKVRLTFALAAVSILSSVIPGRVAAAETVLTISQMSHVRGGAFSVCPAVANGSVTCSYAGDCIKDADFGECHQNTPVNYWVCAVFSLPSGSCDNSFTVETCRSQFYNCATCTPVNLIHCDGFCTVGNYYANQDCYAVTSGCAGTLLGGNTLCGP